MLDNYPKQSIPLGHPGMITDAELMDALLVRSSEPTNSLAPHHHLNNHHTIHTNQINPSSRSPSNFNSSPGHNIIYQPPHHHFQPTKLEPATTNQMIDHPSSTDVIFARIESHPSPLSISQHSVASNPSTSSATAFGAAEPMHPILDLHSHQTRSLSEFMNRATSTTDRGSPSVASSASPYSPPSYYHHHHHDHHHSIHRTLSSSHRPTSSPADHHQPQQINPALSPITSSTGGPDDVFGLDEQEWTEEQIMMVRSVPDRFYPPPPLRPNNFSPASIPHDHHLHHRLSSLHEPVGDGEHQRKVMIEKKRRRRESHNAVERRRRDHINDKITELASLLPDLGLESPSVQPTSSVTVTKLKNFNEQNQDEGQLQKPNKGIILTKSVDYIKQLKSSLEVQLAKNMRLETELSRFKVHQADLRDGGVTEERLDGRNRRSSTISGTDRIGFPKQENPVGYAGGGGPGYVDQQQTDGYQIGFMSAEEGSYRFF